MERRATFVATLVATVAGVGYAPVGPGTLATVAALPLFPLAARVQAAAPAVHAMCLGILAIVAVWAADVAGKAFGEVDSSRIVVDEVVGYLVATSFVDFSWSTTVSTFLLFRLFDIFKPFPISWVERRLGGGLGVVADDVVAGVFAGIVARILQSSWAL